MIASKAAFVLSAGKGDELQLKGREDVHCREAERNLIVSLPTAQQKVYKKS